MLTRRLNVRTRIFYEASLTVRFAQQQCRVRHSAKCACAFGSTNGVSIIDLKLSYVSDFMI